MPTLGLGIGIASPSVKAYSNRFSLALDGTSEYLVVDTNASLTPAGGLTLSAWIKVDWSTSPAYPRIIDKNSSSYRLAIDKSSTAKSIFFYVNGQYAKSTANALDSDDWQHVVAVFDKSLHGSTESITIYVNGSEVTYGVRQSSGSDVVATVDDLHIGSDVGVNKHFAGNIDEVALWSTALDSQAVTEIYNAGKPTDLSVHFGDYDNYVDKLEGYWRMGDATGTDFPIIADSSGSTLGPELIKDGTVNSVGDFNVAGDLAYWTSEDTDNLVPTYDSTNKAMIVTSGTGSTGDYVYYTAAVEVGATYIFSYKVIARNDSNTVPNVRVGRSIGGVEYASMYSSSLHSQGKIFTAATNTTCIIALGVNGDNNSATFTDITLKKIISGNPALIQNAHASNIQEDTP